MGSGDHSPAGDPLLFGVSSLKSNITNSLTCSYICIGHLRDHPKPSPCQQRDAGVARARWHSRAITEDVWTLKGHIFSLQPAITSASLTQQAIKRIRPINAHVRDYDNKSISVHSRPHHIYPLKCYLK